MFKQNFSSNMNYLRRRFSSSDLQGEIDKEEKEAAVLQFNRKGPSPSAPSSPSKSGPAGGLTRGLFASMTQSVQQQRGPGYNKDRCKILLVIDDLHTDW